MTQLITMDLAYHQMPLVIQCQVRAGYRPTLTSCQAGSVELLAYLDKDMVRDIERQAAAQMEAA